MATLSRWAGVSGRLVLGGRRGFWSASARRLSRYSWMTTTGSSGVQPFGAVRRSAVEATGASGAWPSAPEPRPDRSATGRFFPHRQNASRDPRPHSQNQRGKISSTGNPEVYYEPILDPHHRSSILTRWCVRQVLSGHHGMNTPRLQRRLGINQHPHGRFTILHLQRQKGGVLRNTDG